jgi:hypothetical protein
MASDSDANLTRLAAEILREAVQALDHEDVVSWLMAASVGMVASGQVTSGIPAAVTGAFPSVTGAFAATGAFAGITGSFPTVGNGYGAIAGAGLKKVFKLPGRLPGIRLPSDAELVTLARSASLMARLESLARWLGRDGRAVTVDGQLFDSDVADAAERLGVQPRYVPYLLDYSRTAGWLEIQQMPGRGQTRAVVGETAWRWADGDDSGALHVWGAVFAAVLARTLDRAAAADPAISRKLKLQGQGVAGVVMLLLSRRAGLSGADVRDLVMSGAIGSRPSSRARRAWGRWVRDHGDPARWLLGELASLRAISLPGADGEKIELTPLALWALREQLRLDGVQIPLLKATPAQMTAAALVIFANGVSQGEVEAEFASWVKARGADQAARELLAFAAFGGPQARLPAVNLVRRIGAAALPAWRDAMQRPALRGYGRMALLAELPESTMRALPDPDPDDFARVATDLLALACGEEDPDPREIAAQFREAVPTGEESWVFGLMAQSSHPDVRRVLMVLGRYHPDRRIARDARRAARSAARKRTVGRDDRIPARPSGR